jgi:hypothetical protein
MASLSKSFRTKSVGFDSYEKISDAPKPDFSKQSHQLKEGKFDFSTVSGDGSHIACSSGTHQSLRLLGYDNTRIRDTLHTVDVLKNLAERPIDAVVFSSVMERNKLGMGAMASVASICNISAADAGVTVRILARLYARNKRRANIDDIERFVKWRIERSNRGEVLRGVPVEFTLFSKMNGRRAVKSKARKFRSAVKKSGKKIVKSFSRLSSKLSNKKSKRSKR